MSKQVRKFATLKVFNLYREAEESAFALRCTGIFYERNVLVYVAGLTVREYVVMAYSSLSVLSF